MRWFTLFVASSPYTRTQSWPSSVSEMVGALSYKLNECAHSKVNTAVTCSSIGCQTMQTPTLQHDWSTHNHCPLEQIREMDCPYKQIDSSELESPTPDFTAKLSIAEDTSLNTSSFSENKSKKTLNCNSSMNYSNVIHRYIWPRPSFLIQCDSFGTRSKKMRISQRLFIRFWTCIYDYIPCFMRSMSILEEMMEMFATTVQAELNASHATYRNWKTTFDVKLLRLVRTSCRQPSQTWSVAFSSAWTVVANISIISSNIDMLLMKQGM